MFHLLYFLFHYKSETYLKSFKAPPATNKLSDEEILKLNGHIEVEAPGHDLYKWTGTLCLDSGDSILDEDNLLLRVCYINI